MINFNISNKKCLETQYVKQKLSKDYDFRM